MRTTPVTLLAVLVVDIFVGACVNRLNVQCIENSNCDLSFGGVCTTAPTGNHWCAYPAPECLSGMRFSDDDVGDGVSGVCVGVGSDPGVDAGPPTGPIVDNGQAAELVLGQESFDTSEINHRGLSAASLSFPDRVAVSETGAIGVLDSGNCRALKWESAPAVNFQPSVLVVGAPDFTTPETGSITATTLSKTPNGIATAGGKLLISDGLAHRVLIWNQNPTTNGQPASIVLGQTDFTSQKVGAGASDFKSPAGIWTDGTRLAIADVGNNRVMIWTTFPIVNNQAANLVLGQPDFGLNASTPPSATSMHFPNAVHFDGTRFYVADGPNARVLVWKSFPTTNGQPADYVLGQPTLASGGTGYQATQLGYAADVLVAGNSLFVQDTGNDRVLIYSPIPTTSGVPASFVLGAPDFSGPGIGRLTQASFSGATGFSVQGHALYVVDDTFQRVLRFRLQF